ncbi:MAG TPA: hypothetical protein ENK18_16740 [Deltaproteobacteria bacterium]|nr:hypothetical protein [Deltaproteobacteria bacterium]
MIALVLTSCAAPPRISYRGHAVVEVSLDHPTDLQQVLELTDDVWSEHVTDTITVRLDRGGQQRLAELGFDHRVRIPDIQALAEHLAEISAGTGLYEDWQELEAIEEHLDALAQQGPHAERIRLGTSVEGRPIWGLELVGGGAPADRLGVLVHGAQHAREWVSASTALYLADQLALGYGVEPEATAILDGWQVLIVPVMNPDGYRYTWTTDRLWRKNRRDNGDGTHGVDLNRNWATGWGGAGSSPQPSSINHRGPGPFSEPETAAIRDFLLDHPRYGRHLDLHCTGQFILYPWGFTPKLPPDEPALADIADQLSIAIDSVHGAEYKPGPFNTRLYPASGVAIDWTHAQGMQSYLIELRDRGHYGFLLPPDQILPTAEEAWAGFAQLIAAPEPPRLWLRSDDPVLVGTSIELHTYRAHAGDTIEIWWTTSGPGSTPVPGGPELELDDLLPLGASTADSEGHAILEVSLPPSVGPGDPLRLQASSDAGMRSQILPIEVY